MTVDADSVGHPETELEAARRERDDALRELAEARQHTDRLRDRLEERLASVTEQLAAAEASLTTARRELKRLRTEPALRLALLATRAARRTLGVGQSLGGRASGTAAQPSGMDADGSRSGAGISDSPAHLDADAFRSRFLAVLPCGGRRPATPLHVAVVAAEGAEPTDERLVRALEDSGFRASRMVFGEAQPRWDRSIGLAILVSASISRGAVPRSVLSVPWVRDDVDGWLTDPRFADHDLLLASDADARPALVARTGKPVALMPSAAPLDLGPLVDALETWGRARKVAIHIGPRSWDESAQWGDTPFARGIQRELEGRGCVATVHVVEDRDSEPAARADVSLHLIGGRIPDIRPGQTTLLWVISHPDRVTAALCDTYDAVFVASDLYAGHLARRTRTRVLALHQATDPERFYPDPTGPQHELLFVGNSRRTHRPILDALAGTTRDLAVYGTAWTPDLLDQRYLRGAWVPNDQLRRYYSSAAIVLNDHWRDMRDEGFISNRIYDALACGAFVVSDQVPGLSREFDGAVATYDRAEQLEGLIDHFMANPDERRERAARGRAAVLASHTFAQRVETILGVVESLAPALGRSSSGRAPTPPPRDDLPTVRIRHAIHDLDA